MAPGRQLPSRRLRLAISVLVVAHLSAVFLPPLAFQTSGPLGLSPSVATALAPVEPYTEFTYLNRGYAFFAPDPGPSHLIQAGITDPAGELNESLYPDLERQWPRLLYHRNFMLAEFLNEIHQPPGPPPTLDESDPQAAESWRRGRSRYETVRRSMTRHLQSRYPDSGVAIRRIEHRIPDVISFRRDAIDLTDPRLYQVLLDQPVQLDPAETAPAGDPEAVPSPDGRQTSQQRRRSPSPSPADREAR